MKVFRFEQLEVWQAAHALVLEIYRYSLGLPPDERFGLVGQMRRAAVSVPANIAEGFKRRRPKDKARFYNISQASLEELRYYLILCQDLGYLRKAHKVSNQTTRIAQMLTKLINATRNEMS
ncbi:MAG TPA: four helix bundle protein [Gammaproteobacteria bacterium]|nr:four helix bundle protein [Gammaproteobacteria bacterium]